MPDYYIDFDNLVFCELTKNEQKHALFQKTHSNSTGRKPVGSRSAPSGWSLVPNPHRKQETRLRNRCKRQEGWDCRAQTGPTTSARRKT